MRQLHGAQLKKAFSLAVFLLLCSLPASAQHTVVLTWTASASAAGCTSATGCVLTYQVFRGTTPGGEGATPVNSSPITALTFTDTTVSVGSAQVTYYYTVQAVETSAGVAYLSSASNEVSATFLGNPAAPVLGTPTKT